MTTLPAPFKCVGGKGRLVPWLVQYAPPPNRFHTYCEPFVGGGALFRHLAGHGCFQGKSVVLCDASDSVVLPWADLRSDHDLLRAQTESLFKEYVGTPEDARGAVYVRQRAWWNSDRDRTGANAIFLRQTGYNGLWRVNKKGAMNVPWGKYKNPTVPDLDALAPAMSNVVVHEAHFAETMARAEEGWWVYVDPPYVGQFSAYTASGFELDQQRMLVLSCAAAAARGAYVMYSNAWDPAVLSLLMELWPQAQWLQLQNQQAVAPTGRHRGKVKELLAYGNAV